MRLREFIFSISLKGAPEIEKTTKVLKTLERQIKHTTASVDKAETAFGKLFETIGKGSFRKVTQAIDNMQGLNDMMAQQKDVVRGLLKDYNELNKSFKEISKTRPPPAPRAGGGGVGGGRQPKEAGFGQVAAHLQVVGLNAWLATHQLQQAATAVQNYLNQVYNFGKTVGSMVLEEAAAAKKIKEQAMFLGMSKKDYQELAFVFETQGVKTREMADIFAQLAQRVDMANRGSKEANKTFQDIGLSAKELIKLSPEELFYKVGDGAKNLGDAQARLAKLGINLGEEAMKQVGPLMLMGSEYIKMQKAQASFYGVVKNDKQIEELTALGAAFRKIQMIVRGIKNTFVGALAAPMTRFFKALDSYYKKNRDRINKQVEQLGIKLGHAIDYLTPKVIWLIDYILDSGIDNLFIKAAKAMAFITGASVAGSLFGAAYFIGLAAVNMRSAFLLFRPMLPGIQNLPLVARVMTGISGVMSMSMGAFVHAVAGLAAAAVLVYAGLSIMRYVLTGGGPLKGFVDTVKDTPTLMGAVARNLDANREWWKQNLSTISLALEAVSMRIERVVTVWMPSLFYAVVGLIEGLIILINNSPVLKRYFGDGMESMRKSLDETAAQLADFKKSNDEYRKQLTKDQANVAASGLDFRNYVAAKTVASGDRRTFQNVYNQLTVNTNSPMVLDQTLSTFGMDSYSKYQAGKR